MQVFLLYFVIFFSYYDIITKGDVMKITGTISRVTYHNKNNGYTVAILMLNSDDYSIIHKKNKLTSNQLTIVGCFDRLVLPEEEYTLNGDFTKNNTYGLQFKFESFLRKNTYTEAGIISYLSSDIFPGIGLKTAKIIVEHLGVEAIDKVYQDKNVLKDIGINPQKIDEIYQVIVDNKANEETILFFLNNGISMDFCHKIVAKLGSNAIEKVKENPYLLMEKIERFGFLKNDVFALKMGLDKRSKIRLRAVTTYVLKDIIYNSGDSYSDIHTLYQGVLKYLRDDEPLDKKEYLTLIDEMVKDKIIYQNNAGWIFDYDLYNNEIDLANNIVSRLSNIDALSDKFTDKQIEKAYTKSIKESQIELNNLQKTAVRAAFKEPICIITGGPGTGKTTIAKTIINMYTHLMEDNSTVIEAIALLAPTGRAAKRLKEVTKINAQTIHKYLGYIGEGHFTISSESPTEERLILIDEASMMDLPLASRLFTSLNKGARIIIFGDVDQLPSVGPGQVLKDLMDTKEIKTLRLTKIHRQAENSKIITMAHSINEGILPEDLMIKYSDRTFIPTDNSHLINLIVEYIKLAIAKGKDIKKDIQVLAPMYRCAAGINELNERIQEVVNPGCEEDTLTHHSQNFRINDKVIQLVNRSEKNIMNGDIGIISNLIFRDGEYKGVTVSYDLGKVDYTLDEMDDLKLAYAISIHKAQGSEFDIVIMPFTNSYFYMLKRKLIYTGITRAKKNLVLIGDIKSLQTGISKIEFNRKTILGTKIREGISPKIKKIDDISCAFDTIGEIETDISPYDFLEKEPKKDSSHSIDDILNSLEEENDFF